MKTDNQNEHDLDCCDFMALSEPHRQTCVSDFMVDNNGCVDFEDPGFDVNVALGWTGTTVLLPDTALMLKEAGVVHFNAAQIEGFRREQVLEDKVIARQNVKESKPRRKYFPAKCPDPLPPLAPPSIEVPSSALPQELRDLIIEAQRQPETTLILAKSGDKRMSGFLITKAGKIKTSEISSDSLEKSKTILVNGAKRLIGKRISTTIDYPHSIAPIGYVFHS